MRLILAKLIRRFCIILEKLRNIFEIMLFKLKYPGLTIDFKTQIGRNVKIVCVDGGKMKIENCSILDGSFIFCDQNAIIDIKDSFIGMNCVIASKEKIIIEEKCLIAEMVVIRDHNHKSLNGLDLSDSSFETKEIIIERNVWLGAKVTILSGVNIAEDSIIGANAVVTKSTEKKSINVGVPSKKIN